MPETDRAYALMKNLQLKEINAGIEDKSTGVTECSARIVIPTEVGPLDSPVAYRVGPAASSGQSVFMYLVVDKTVEDFYDTIQRVADRTPSTSG